MGLTSSLKGTRSFQLHTFKNYFQISSPQGQKMDESRERRDVFFHNDVQKLTSIVPIISGQCSKGIGGFSKTTQTAAEKLSFVSLGQGQAQWMYPTGWATALAELCPLSTEQLVSTGSKLLFPGPRGLKLCGYSKLMVRMKTLDLT